MLFLYYLLFSYFFYPEGQRKAHFEEADVTKRAIKNKVTRLKRKIVELKARIKATRRGGAEDVFASKCK